MHRRRDFNFAEEGEHVEMSVLVLYIFLWSRQLYKYGLKSHGISIERSWNLVILKVYEPCIFNVL